MAEIILRTTPEVLRKYAEELELTSRRLRADLLHIRDLLNQVHTHVDEQNIAHHIDCAMEHANQSEHLSNDLDNVARGIESLSSVYYAAETSFMASLEKSLNTQDLDNQDLV